MGRKDDDEGAPDGSDSLRRLARLAALWRSADFAQGLNPVQWETLRYLAAANRFSNSPGAVARYLGATKGTISQTVRSLEKKGFVARSARAGDQRSVGLALTEKAIALLADDPRAPSLDVLSSLRPKIQRRFAQGLDALLAAESLRLGAAVFGSCPGCRYWRQGGRGEASHCMMFDVTLTPEEEVQLCVAHQPR